MEIQNIKANHMKEIKVYVCKLCYGFQPRYNVMYVWVWGFFCFCVVMFPWSMKALERWDEVGNDSM